MFESARLEVLEPSESLRLLSCAQIGRIIFTDQALPAVQPVNYLLDGDAVLLRTTTGSKLDAAARNAIVAFEVDDIDCEFQHGWSVTVIGHAELVTDPIEIDRLRALPLHSWSGNDQNHFVRVQMEIIQGRRIAPPSARAAS